MPGPFLIFLDGFCQKGSFVPDKFLTRFELERVKTDRYGAFETMTESQRLMIIAFLVISKVLCQQILLKPQQHGLPFRINKISLKLIASVLHCFVVQIVKGFGLAENDD